MPGVVEDLKAERFVVAWYETKAMAGRVTKRVVDGVATGHGGRVLPTHEGHRTGPGQQGQCGRGRAGTVLTKRQLGVLHGQARARDQTKEVLQTTSEWADRARPWVGEDEADWAAALAGRDQPRTLHAADISDAMLTDVARAALAVGRREAILRMRGSTPGRDGAGPGGAGRRAAQRSGESQPKECGGAPVLSGHKSLRAKR